MRLRSSLAIASVLLGTTAFAAAPPRVHRGPTSPKLFKDRTAPAKPKEKASIAPERATEIQTALVKAGYLNGTPSGTWDAETQSAMQKLQADNGWQTKLVPDSRAIIKLGLGPNSTPASELANTPSEPAEPSAPAENVSSPANK